MFENQSQINISY